MKVWQAGLLVAGAAIAGGLAVKLTELPPVAVEAPAQGEPAPLPWVAPPVATVQTPPPTQAPPPPDIADAPPPVFSEPSHVKPSPSPKALIPVAQPLIQPAARAPESAPVTQPAPYQEPSPVVSPNIVAPSIVAPKIAEPEAEKKSEPSRRAVLESGSGVVVRFTQPLSADRVRLGDIFQGVLADPLVANGFVVGERGALVNGRVVDVQRSGITLRLLNFQSADGQRIEVSTEPWSVKSVESSTIVRFRLAARITVTERRL